MGYNRKGMWGIAAGAVALGIVGASIAVAGLVAGGGPTKTDCYAEWDISGIASAGVTGGKKVTCMDGAACDANPAEGVCGFQVRQCWNQPNPSLPGCTPPDELDRLKVSKALSMQIPTSLQGASCFPAFVDAPLTVDVATKKRGKKPGKKSFRVMAKASKGTNPRTDNDNYQLICQPASASGAFLD